MTKIRTDVKKSLDLNGPAAPASDRLRSATYTEYVISPDFIPDGVTEEDVRAGVVSKEEKAAVRKEARDRKEAEAKAEEDAKPKKKEGK